VSVRALTYAVNGHRCVDCPKCGQAARVGRVRDRLTFKCYGGCAEDQVAPLVEDQDQILEELVVNADRGDAAKTAADRLGELLELPSAGLRITGARIVGRGGSASADLYLSDGSEITFPTLSEFANPNRLAVEMGAATGVVLTLKRPAALRALALLRELAKHEETVTADELSVEWGLTFLQAADPVDVDMDDQGQRWGAFSELNRRDPVAAARSEGTSVARACVVLCHLDGTRFVRAGWFRAHVRQEDVTVSPQEITTRMARVGWRRRAGEGWIKATRPGFRDVLRWRFYLVPAGWGDDG
jgi:hypothetical protein